jgi:general secretion pathway protein L
MSDHLVIRLFSDDRGHAEWIVVGPDGDARTAVSRGSLDAAADAAKGRHVDVLLPADQILHLTTNIPARGSRLLQALPYALEDEIADEVEALHFAAGSRDDDGVRPVTVIATDVFQGWLDDLAEHGIEANALYSIADTLRRMPGMRSLMLSDDLLIINDDAPVSQSLDGLSPEEALRLAATAPFGADAAAPTHVRLVTDEATRARLGDDIAALHDQVERVDVSLLADGGLPTLAAGIVTAPGVNLLQGRYAPQSSVAARWRPWRLAASLLLACFVVLMVAKTADFLRLRAESTALRAQVEDALSSLNVRVTEGIDPVDTLASELRKITGASVDIGSGDGAVPSEFLPTLSSVARAIQQIGPTSVQAISFRNGILDMRITAPDTAALDRLTKAIDQGNALRAEIQRTEQDGDAVRGYIQIVRAGA